MNKKGQISGLQGTALAFGLGIVVIAVVALIITSIQTTTAKATCSTGYTVNGSYPNANCWLTANDSQPNGVVDYGAGYNTTSYGLQGVGNVSGQLPLLATVIVFGIVLAVVVGFLGMKRTNG